MARKRNKGAERRIAGERIDVLMALAERSALAGKLGRSDRYAHLARRIAMRYNLRLPRRHKRRMCPHCYRYLHPGVTSSVRLRAGRVTVLCARCGGRSRFPMTKEKRRESYG